MNLWQKVGRIILFTSTLVVASVLAAMLGALILFVIERGRELGTPPEFWNGLGIILIGIAVNAGCLFVLLQIKKADTHLMRPFQDQTKDI